MQKEEKKESNVVKIQVEAKNPPRRRRIVHVYKNAKPSKPKVKLHRHIASVPKNLIENFVGLQKVQANLAEKLDALTKQLSELLKLFETTAKTFAENPAILTSERDKEFIDKINQLLEQDKVIAKGVVYIEDRVDAMEKATMTRPQQAIISNPLPKV